MFNGRRYNALTGEAVAETAQQPAVRTINDMVVGQPKSSPGRPVVLTATAAKAAPAAPAKVSKGPKVMDVSRSVGHTKPRQTQRANTLVRASVSKPKPGFKSQVKVTAPTKALLPSSSTVAPKLSVSQVNPGRVSRAGQATKSAAISKFSASTTVGASQETPQARAAVNLQAPVEAIQQQSTDSQAFFERAIAAAESHTFEHVDEKQLAKQASQQAKRAAKAMRQPVHHRVATVMAASAAVLIIGGFIGLQNKTALTLRFANAQAGFQASLPNYQPAGYGVGAFNYSAGNVGTTFHSNAADRSYTLNQQTTKWDSQDLLDNFVTVNYPNYQAIQSGEKIVYIYGDNNASWVSGGIWYQLMSNGSLSSTQVIAIAASV